MFQGLASLRFRDFCRKSGAKCRCRYGSALLGLCAYGVNSEVFLTHRRFTDAHCTADQIYCFHICFSQIPICLFHYPGSYKSLFTITTSSFWYSISNPFFKNSLYDGLSAAISSYNTEIPLVFAALHNC